MLGLGFSAFLLLTELIEVLLPSDRRGSTEVKMLALHVTIQVLSGVPPEVIPEQSARSKP